MDEDKVKARRSYATFKELSVLIDKNPSKKELLEKVHAIIDNCNGFHSQTNSDKALESIELVLKGG